MPIKINLIDLLTGWDIKKSLDEIDTYKKSKNYKTLQKKRINDLLEIHNSLTLNDKNSIKDFDICTKDDIRKKPIINPHSKYLIKKTGGSTGTPLKYRASTKSQGYLWAGIITSWKEAGYTPGEKIVFLGGSSVVETSIQKRILYKLLNIYPLTSFGINEEVMKSYIATISNQNIKYMYGYSNAILMLAKCNLEYHLNLHLKGVICTAEMLSDSARSIISKSFQCDVYCQYGANDGGISGFECREHDGYHIITTRSLVEVINGEVISTDLINNAQLFIRYKIGDQAELDLKLCPCGCKFPKLINMKGRSNDIITDVNGNIIHSEFFTHMFREYELIDNWQIIVKNKKLYVNLHQNASIGIIDDEIKGKISLKCSFDEIKIEYNKPLELMKNGKFKFVIQH